MSTKPRKRKSPQAEVAAIIKNELAAMGIKCRAKSSSFSMGNSVDIKLKDVPAPQLEAIKARFSIYQYGHFDGMQDMYEYSNRRGDIPQTKYLSINCEYSDEVKQAAWDWVRGYFAQDEMQDAPESVADIHGYQKEVCGRWADRLLWDVLSGAFEIYDIDTKRHLNFWGYYRPDATTIQPSEEVEPQIQAPGDDFDTLAASVRVNPERQGYEIEFTDKPSQATREKLKAAGFRWSHKLGYWYAKQNKETGALAYLLADTAPGERVSH